MMISEMVKLFIDSRRRGMTGARRKCTQKTVEGYEYHLKNFTSFLVNECDGLMQYESLKRMHIVQFLDWLDKKQEAGWSKATCLGGLRTLRTFFRWVDCDEDCQSDELHGLQKYIPAIEKNPRRTDIPQVKDLKSFKNGFNTQNRWGFRDYVATCLMLDTGIRLGEVCNLRVDHMLLDERLLIVDGKTGPRPVPITSEMARLLKAWLKRRANCITAKESAYTFVSKYRPQMDPNGFGQRFRKHRAKFGLPRISAHTLRHSFCTHYLRKGGDMEKLRMITGHTTYDMLREYLHLAKVGGQAAQQELEKVSLLKEL